MVLLLLLATFFIPSDSRSIRAHASDTLKMKCDALPFRTSYTDSRCLFVLMTEQSLAESNHMCSEILPAAKVSSAPSSVFNSLFVEKSEFHTPSFSKGDKKALCSYEIRQVCGDGEPLLPGGKCAFKNGKKMNYANAQAFCESKSASLPVVYNDDENTAISEFLESNSAWVELGFSKKWSAKSRFTRYAMCPKSGYSHPTSKNQRYCKTDFAFVANGGDDSRGYWSGSDQKELQGVICVHDASSDYWTVKIEAPRPTFAPKVCIEEHEFDKYTGECKWSGPEFACAKLIHRNGQSMYVTIPGYPNNTKGQVDLANGVGLQQFPGFNDNVDKTVVRQGCRASYWGDKVDGKMLMWKDVPHGKWEVPCFYKGSAYQAEYGLSTVVCECDPPSKSLDAPEKKVCVEDHKYDSKTGQCEWTGPKNACVKIIHYNGPNVYVYVPNYPNNVKAWAEMNNNAFPGYNDNVANTVIRKGCRASYWGDKVDGVALMWRNVPYGKWEVPCYHKGQLTHVGLGLSNLICECDPKIAT